LLMVSIVPTITASEPHAYREQMERVEQFAGRIHIDVADGKLAPRKLIDLDRLWWPGNVVVDLHMMFERPFEHTDLIQALHPQLVIVHAEALGDFYNFAYQMHLHGIEVGVALLPNTPVSRIEAALGSIDHVLIFSGNLGYQGGSSADMSLLHKVQELRKLKPTLEIGWDGGVGDQNARELVKGGIDVLNVGGFIHSSESPDDAYAKLKEVTNGL
jgi:ribulose-phosphate 3-epimerase